MTDTVEMKLFPDIRSILAVGLDTPEIIALKGVLGSFTHATVRSVSDLSQTGADEAGSDLIISKPDTLATNPDFFLRRQGRVAILTTGGEISNSPFYLVPCDLPEDAFISRCREILEHLSPASSLRSDLSAREIEVLREIAAGLTSKEIAEKLFISVNTVISHRKNLTAKLGIRSVSGLSLYAMMNGLL